MALSQLSILPYPFDLGVGAVFQLFNLPVACGGGLVDGGESLLDAGEPFFRQSVVIGLYGGGTTGVLTNPMGPGTYPIVLGRPAPDAGVENFASLIYQAGTGSCGNQTGLLKTYYAPSGSVTVTELSDAGLSGSFSAMAPDCTALDGGQLNIFSGSFSTTPCPTFDVAMYIPFGC